MPTPSLIPMERIDRAILMLRGHKVILDSDLAALYGVKTKVLNQAVRRNIARFPKDFMFHLTEEESRSCKVTDCDLKDRARPALEVPPPPCRPPVF